PLASLAHIRKEIGEYNFLSQYQQDPAPPGGAMVKTDWLRVYRPEDLPERFDCVLQSWDTANKATELADYSVCTTWGVYDRKYYLLHVFRKRLDYPDLKRAIRDQADQYSPHTVLIEDKASGTQLIQDLIADGFFMVQAYKPPTGSDKIMRLHAQ